MFLAACYKYLEKNLPNIYSKHEIHELVTFLLEKCSFWIKKIIIKGNPLLRVEP